VRKREERTSQGSRNRRWPFRTPCISAPAHAMFTPSKCNMEDMTIPAIISATALELSPLRKMCFFAVDAFTWFRTCSKYYTLELSLGGTYLTREEKKEEEKQKKRRNRQVHSSDEDDPSTKLETSKEELKTGKPVADAQFWNLSLEQVFPSSLLSFTSLPPPPYWQLLFHFC